MWCFFNKKYKRIMRYCKLDYFQSTVYCPREKKLFIFEKVFERKKFVILEIFYSNSKFEEVQKDQLFRIENKNLKRWRNISNFISCLYGCSYEGISRKGRLGFPAIKFWLIFMYYNQQNKWTLTTFHLSQIALKFPRNLTKTVYITLVYCTAIFSMEWILFFFIFIKF